MTPRSPLVFGVLLLTTGCQQAAASRFGVHPATPVQLAASQQNQPSAPEKPKTKTPVASATPTDEKPPVKRYTAPGAAIQQLTLLALGASTSSDASSTDVAGVGREATEGRTALSSVAGRPGVTAPQPTARTAVVSRPGLQQGPAAGLGFAASANLFTPQFNPLSGSRGRCADLSAAGFFGGNRAACEHSFARR